MRLRDTMRRVALPSISLITMLTLHASVIAALVVRPVERLDETGGAVIVELSTVTTSTDEPPRDVAVGRRADEAVPVNPTSVTTLPTSAPIVELPELPLLPTAPPEIPIVQRDDRPPEPKPSEKQPPVPNRATPEAPIQAAPRSEAAGASRVDGAPKQDKITRAQNAGVSTVDRRVAQNWQRELVAHLTRFKRYPGDAKGKTGVAVVSFTLDRTGKIVSVTVARTSGHPALDRAALDMVRRASPLPAPPQAVTGDLWEFAVPTEFKSAGG